MGRSRSAQLRRQLVGELEAVGSLGTDRVRKAFLAVPRELFVGEFAAREGLEAVYRDDVILTKRNEQGTALSSSSQPGIMALMLEQLALDEGMRVLEIGAGTGYNAALLSLLVGERGRVVSIDVDSELAAAARRSLRAGGYRVRVVAGDGRDGFAAGAPYDRIIATASTDSVPVAWHDQLRTGGLLEVPLRLSATGAQPIPLLRRTRTGFRSVSMLVGGFMPLRAAGSDAAAALKHPMLVASDRTAEGDAPLRQLAGDALLALSPSSRRRLLATALGESRRLPLGLRADSVALALFLSLRAPRRSLVTVGPRAGIGVIGRDGRSLALIEPIFARPGSSTSWFRAFGGDEAERLLIRLVAEWVRLGRPTERDLEIRVRFAGGRSRIGTGFRRRP